MRRGISYYNFLLLLQLVSVRLGELLCHNVLVLKGVFALGKHGADLQTVMSGAIAL
jgi:hypothetical protein